MAGDCVHTAHYVMGDTFGNKRLLGRKKELPRDPAVLDAMKGRASTSVAASSPYFEIVDGMLYRKKLENGYTNYREVLDKDRRPNAIATVHRKVKGHHTLEDTYRFVAENYWWEGMYFNIREYVLGCQECQAQQERHKALPEPCVSRTLASHGDSVLSKLRGQREAGLFCDITLKTSGRSFPAHRAVLAAVSEYFQEIFAEMDSTSSPCAAIDLTGFSEEIFLPLLEFSYTSTLSLRAEDLGEVSTMARHFRMWAAVEACGAIQSKRRAGRGRSGATSSCLWNANGPPPHAMSPDLVDRQQDRLVGAGGFHRKRKREMSVPEVEPAGSSRKRTPPALARDHVLNESINPSDGSEACLPGENGLPCSPARRLKLLDFKSPSSKTKASPAPCAPSSPSSGGALSLPAHQRPGRVLRSGTVAPQEWQLRGSDSSRSRVPRVSAPIISSTSSSSKHKQGPSFAEPGAGPVKEEPVEQEVQEEEVQSPSMVEKCKLLSMLGLQRKSLLPNPVPPTGWRQKKRLRTLKVSSYSLTTRRNPRPAQPAVSSGSDGDGGTLALPAIKTEPPELVALEDAQPKRGSGCGRIVRGMAVTPDTWPPSECRELRRSARIRDAPLQILPRLRTRKAEMVSSCVPRRKPVRVKREPSTFAISPPALPAHNAHHRHRGEPLLSLKARGSVPVSGRTGRYVSALPVTSTKRDRRSLRSGEVPRAGSGVLWWREAGPDQSDGRSPSTSCGDSRLHGLQVAIKDEPADPVAVTAPVPVTTELGKRRCKPPIKLLDPGFLFDFCRPVAGLKREEESVDICLTRSVSQNAGRLRRAAKDAGPSLGFNRRRPRHRGAVPASPPKKRGTSRRASGGRGVQDGPHRPPLASSGKRKTNRDRPKCRRSRLQLRKARGRALVTSHTCVECRATSRNCDSLIMHRIRHIEGKHWPCPLCSKTFFRQSNVQNHIRTHDQRLYRCRACMSAA